MLDEETSEMMEFSHSGDIVRQLFHDQDDDSDVRPVLPWRYRIGRRFRRSQPPMLAAKKSRERWDWQSEHLSVGGRSAATIHSEQSHIECVYHDDNPKSRVSLADFLEKGPMQPTELQLSNIAAEDGASVASANLAVSFDDDYAQLVLRASSSTEEEDEALHELLGYDTPLGVAFPHPAVGSSDDASSRTESRASRDAATYQSTRMEKVAQPRSRPRTDRPKSETREVWDQLDREERSSRDASSSDSTPRPSPVQIDRKDTDWNLGWSFSHDDSVISFSSVLGKSIVKPLCRLMDDMNSVCGSEDIPYDEQFEATTDVSSLTRPSLAY